MCVLILQKNEAIANLEAARTALDQAQVRAHEAEQKLSAARLLVLKREDQLNVILGQDRRALLCEDHK